jgi:hypothetical protein
MSHELRTPLNSALILSKLLGDNAQGNLTAEQVKFAESIYSSGNDLLVLINDILDIAKVEAGQLEVVPEQVALASVAESLRMTFTPLANDKKLAFRLDIAPDAPASLVTDRQRMEQILKNLLSNALKFTDRGEVRLQVSAAAGGGARFAVSPGYTHAMGQACKDAGLPLLPGVATGSEIMTAQQDGLTELKFFPAMQAGGPAMLKAWNGPFGDVRFCPTGGVTVANAPEFLALPNVVCVGGSWLTPADTLARGNWSHVTALAFQACQLERNAA